MQIVSTLVVSEWKIQNDCRGCRQLFNLWGCSNKFSYLQWADLWVSTNKYSSKKQVIKPLINRYLRLISEFKETVLLNIYEYSTKYFLDIFMKELKFDKIDQLLVFIIEIAKCLISSFEFDENNLYDKSDKYFIVIGII